MQDGFIKVAVGTPEIRVADCAFNAAATIRLMQQAQQKGVRLLVLPELGLTGYTCADLFFQPSLLQGAQDALEMVRCASAGMKLVTIVGLPLPAQGKLFNCAAVIYQGEILGFVTKKHLPNYGEFYEQRWFSVLKEYDYFQGSFGKEEIPFGPDLLFCCEQLPEFCFAVEICEDLWATEPPSNRYAEAGALLIANLSASSETVGKAGYRRALVTGQSGRLVCGYLYADAGEGESTTDLVFGAHNLIAENGNLLAESRFEQGLLISEIDVYRLASERRRMTTYPRQNQGCLHVGFSMPISICPKGGGFRPL